MKTAYFTDRNEALAFLLAKYEVSGDGKLNEQGKLETAGETCELLPWRVERRFIELKNLIDNQTLEDVSTLRFAHLTSAGEKSLSELIYKELDLCEWLGGAPVKRLFAVFSGDQAANIIVKLENGLSCSVECSVMLPEGEATIDRHEIIARRGVASDQVVDTQLPQNSLYAFTGKEKQCFTDVDAEIFGLPKDDVTQVRAAFDVLANPELAATWQQQHKHLLDLVEQATVSANQ